MRTFFLCLLLVASLLIMTGCGRTELGPPATPEATATIYPDVEGVYDLHGTYLTNCWGADESTTHQWFGYVVFTQDNEDPGNVTMTNFFGPNPNTIVGVLDTAGNFLVTSGSGDPQVSVTYAGYFYVDEHGEAYYHEGALEIFYYNNYCGTDFGYYEYQFWGGKDNSAPPG